MKNKLSKDYLEIMDDFEQVEAIIRERSKTFYQSFSTLPDKKRYAIYSVYAFCRKADDLIDKENNLDGLNNLKNDLDSFARGQDPQGPIWSTLRVVFNNFHMDIDPFYDMIKGQKMDVDFEQPGDLDALEDYSYHVASSVGLMILPILSENPDKIKDQAISLGIAMQITNILRDLYEDYLNDRIYVPEEVLAQYNYDLEGDFQDEKISDNFFKVWDHLKDRAVELYAHAETMMEYIDQDSKKAVWLALEYYKAILYKIESDGFDIFGPKTKVSKLDKLQLLNKVNKKI